MIQIRYYFKISNLKNLDWFLVIPLGILAILGVLNVLSTTYFDEKKISPSVYTHIIFLIAGFGILLFFSVFNVKKLFNIYSCYFIFFINTLLLILVLLIGVEVDLTKRWLDLGFFQIQPSEISKVGIIFWVSFFLPKIKNNGIKFFGRDIKKYLSFYFPLISLTFFLLTTFGLIYLQNSLGNLLLSIIICFLLIFFFLDLKINYIILIIFFINGYFSWFLNNFLGYKFFGISVLFSFLTLFLGWYFSRKFKFYIFLPFILFIFGNLTNLGLNFAYHNLLQPYQRKRIESFLAIDQNLSGANYQIFISRNAIYSSGIYGKGFLNSQYANSKLLPAANNDFAFSAFAEQFGLLGILFLYLVYFFIFFRLNHLGSQVSEGSDKLLVYGSMLLIFVNFMQHVGMNFGFLPVTGVPLPLISEGGSNLISIFISLGITFSIISDIKSFDLNIKFI